MPVEHFLIGKQIDFDTLQACTHAYPMDNFNVDETVERIDFRNTGSGRALRQRANGAVVVSGSGEMPLPPEKLGFLLLAAGFTITTTTPGVANARLHGALPSDSTFTYLSAQVQYSATVAQDVMSMLLNTFTISCAAKEAAKFAFEWMARDAVGTGQTWHRDGSAAPSIVASPTYWSQSLRPFIFKDATIYSGGTPTLNGTTKRFSVAGATAQAKIERIEITVENNLEYPHFLRTDETAKLAYAADRVINVSFDLDQSTPNTDFYTNMRNGTTATLQLLLESSQIESGHNYTCEITIPVLDYDAAQFAPISGDQARRKRAITATAIQDPTSTYDIGIALKDTQTAY